MGIFKRRDRVARRRRSGSDARREARWKKTQEIVNGLFPADRYRPLPAQNPLHRQDARDDAGQASRQHEAV
jgi:hypothetical protein